MRIAHVSATFPPYLGSGGNFCYHNALELAKRGHEVHVFTPNYENNIPFEQLNGIIVHRLIPLFQFGNSAFIP